jgi:hypothetical protein
LQLHSLGLREHSPHVSLLPAAAAAANTIAATAAEGEHPTAGAVSSLLRERFLPL